MKKTEKVSIANISFTLDDDAYLALKQYLDSLNGYYGDDPDGREIVADIEARIAELILGEQVYTKLVTKARIDRIIAQLGAPEEFDGREDEEPVRPASPADQTIPRRLYRSGDGRLLGGVCRGMAQFWNVNVAWIRLAFLAPLIMALVLAPFNQWIFREDFFRGFSWVFTVIYIVLWIALPMARTPRQKLEARGERITPSSIRQGFQESATSPSTKKAASIAAEIFAVIGRIVLFFIKFMVAVVGFSLLIAAFAMFIAMLILLTNPVSVIGLFSGLSILSPIMFAALALFCAMIPMAVIGMGLLSLVFSWKPGRIVFTILLSVWLLAMIFCSIVLVGNVRYLRDEIRNHDSGVTEWFDSHKNGTIRWHFNNDDDNSRVRINWRDDTDNDTGADDKLEPEPGIEPLLDTLTTTKSNQ
jgi:phage shock protein PspC (stress-responsive transcriptional regulator)